MSFFDDNKNIGLLVLILGLANIIVGIAYIAFADGRSIAGGAMFLIGYLICGIIILITGLSIRASNEQFGILSLLGGIVGLKIAFDNQKGVVCLLLMVMGITRIIEAIFSAIGSALWNSMGYGIGGIVIAFIVGIFFIYTSTVISGDRKSSAGNILWIILLILVILGIIVYFLAILGALLFPAVLLVALLLMGICGLLISIYLLIRVLSPEIKSALGVT